MSRWIAGTPFPETALANLRDCVRDATYSPAFAEIQRNQLACPTCGRGSLRTTITVRGCPPRAYLIFEHYFSGYRHHRRVLPSDYAGMIYRLGVIRDAAGVAASLADVTVTDSERAWRIGLENLNQARCFQPRI